MGRSSLPPVLHFLPMCLKCPILSVCFLAAGAGWAPHQVLAEKPAQDDRKEEPQPAAKKDYHGDPLPPGVLARMGSVHLRHCQAAFAFSADAKTLISAGSDQNVHTWDVATGKLSKTTRIQRATRKSESFDGPEVAPGGKILVAREGKHAFLYDTSSGKEIQSFPVEEDQQVWFTFSPDGKLLAIKSRDREGSESVCVREVKTGKERFSQALPKTIRHVAFSPDGKRLAVSTSTDGVRLVDTADGKQLAHIAANGWSMAYSPNGKALATAGAFGGTVNLWDPNTFAVKETIKVEGVRSISNLSFGPDGTLLGFRDQDDLVVWDLSKQNVVQRLKDANVYHPVFAPNGKILAATGSGCEIHLWDLTTGEPIHRRP